MKDKFRHMVYHSSPRSSHYGNESTQDPSCAVQRCWRVALGGAPVPTWGYKGVTLAAIFVSLSLPHPEFRWWIYSRGTGEWETHSSGRGTPHSLAMKRLVVLDLAAALMRLRSETPDSELMTKSAEITVWTLFSSRISAIRSILL